MTTAEDIIISLADKLKDPEEYLNALEKLPLQPGKRAEFFLHAGNVLFGSSNVALAMRSWNHALQYFIKEKSVSQQAQCYGNIGIGHQTMGDFKNADIFLEKSLEMMKQIDDKAGQASALVKIGNNLVKLGQFKRSIESYNCALEKADGQTDVELACYQGLGDAYHYDGDFRSAMVYHKRLLDGTQPSDKKRRANLLVRVANDFIGLGDFTKAIEILNEAKRIYIDIGYADLGSTWYNSIGVAYVSSCNFDEAIKSFKKALEIDREIADTKSESKSYNNLGNAYEGAGNFKEAIACHKKSLEIKRSVNDKAGEAKALANIGNVYHSMGELQKNIEYQEKSLQIAKEIENRAGESASYINLGTAYNELGNCRKAIELFNKSLKIEQERDRVVGQATAYRSLGIAYEYLGDFKTAIEYQQKSLEIAKNIGDISEIANCYDCLAVNYTNLGDLARAKEYEDKAISIDQERDDKIALSSHYANLGNIYLGMSNFKQAAEAFDKALAIFEEIGEVEGQRNTNYCLCKTYLNSDDELAYSYCRRSIELSDMMSNSLVGEQHKSSFHATFAFVYQTIVPLCVKLGKNEEAFQYVESSKSRAFLDLLAATRIRPTVKITSELRSLLQEEENSLQALRSIQLRHMKVQKSLANSQGSSEVREKLEQIYEKMNRLDPNYVQARRVQSSSSEEIKQVLNSLKKPAILIEYFTTDSKTFIFTVSNRQKKIEVRVVNAGEKEIRAFFPAFSSEVAFSKGKHTGRRWLGLSELLIKPVSDLITGHELVYFVPYGQLHYLPLHALELDGEPLIKNYAVAYAPSASLIKFCQNKGSGKLESCVSFGVALKGQIRLERIVEDTANGVAKFFNTKAYNGNRASKETALKEIENKDIVHFSCHGYLNQEEPLSSGVVLYNEEILSAKEIFDLKLNAEIVTLGACQTGVSERSLGDELVGLTRAFLYAGAPSLIVALWSVNASSTKELMLEFYKLAKSGVRQSNRPTTSPKQINGRKVFASLLLGTFYIGWKRLTLTPTNLDPSNA